MRKLSAASPQYCFIHSMFAWNPPEDATTAFARTVAGKPLLVTIASRTKPSSRRSAVTSES